MSKRLQVILDDEEFEEIRRVARRRRMTLSEWVRQSLRDSRREEPSHDAERKLSVVREAARHAYPTAEIGVMLVEIEAGYTPDDG
jgi:hypothetical protein